MAKKWNEIRAERDRLPDIEQRRAYAREQLEHEIAIFEFGLAQLRHARGLTQEQLAKALEVSQPQVSRLEHQTDLYLSTLRSYVEAMGGELVIAARFDDADVELEIEDLTGADEQDGDREHEAAGV